MTKNKKRIVVKIGTSILTQSVSFSAGKGELGVSEDTPLNKIIRQIVSLKKQGYEIILVTSGAIGAGMKKLGWNKKPDEMRKKQAAAAVGQVSLMNVYEKLFQSGRITVAQVLLSRTDIEDRQRYLNAKNTLLTLLKMGVVPVINENDTVATDEIKFGDNDMLSALVAAKIDADLLIILSDVDGLYRSMKEKNVVPVVEKITPEIQKMACEGVKSEMGTGGMKSKIDAAKIATAGGVTMIIANASEEDALKNIIEGKIVGTKFISSEGLNAKEKWILFGAIPKGEITIDSGAVKALKELGKSLLPAGIKEIKGQFKKNDVVQIKTEESEEIARGMISFSSNEVEKIKGKKSSEISKILGSKSQTDEVVHRDSLVLIPSLWK